MQKILDWGENIVTELLLDEIQREKYPEVIFRGDSIATKSWSGFAKIAGRKYLASLQPILRKVHKDHKKQSDRDRESTLLVVQYADAILHTLYQKYNIIGENLHNVLSAVTTGVQEKHPDHLHQVLANLFFLRFVVPSLIQPETYEIISEINPKAKRFLVSVSKVIQNLSCGQKFDPSDNLAFANPFIKENYKAMASFIKGMGRQSAPHSPCSTTYRQGKEFPHMKASLSLNSLPSITTSLCDPLSNSEENILSSGSNESVNMVGGTNVPEECTLHRRSGAYNLSPSSSFSYNRSSSSEQLPSVSESKLL